MVKIQIDLPKDIDKFISIKKQVMGLKDKRQTIIFLLSEAMKKNKAYQNMKGI